MIINNKYPIPGSRGYTIDLETHMVYASNGRHMKPHVDKRKRVCTKVLMETGKQRLFVIKDVVRKIKEKEGNPLEKQQLSLEKDYQLKYLMRQISTYHTIMLNLSKLKALKTEEERTESLRELGLGLDLELASEVVGLIK
jgi:hypothetical protein